MKVEVLFFQGCPHYPATVSLLRQVIGDLRLSSEVREIEVRSQEEAERLRFLGSPSVRVDGVDLEPGAAAGAEFGLSCRLYGSSGVPPRALLEAALGRGSER